MHEKNQLLFTWTGLVSVMLFFIGIFPLAHLLPPPISPLTPVAEVMAFYTEHHTGILFGEIVILWAAALMIPFFAVIYTQIRRIEGGNPLLATVFLAASIMVIMEIIIPAWNFTTVAFREHQSAEITLAFSDQAWIMFVWPNPVTCIFVASIGYAILQDRHPDPLFPRWVGFANLLFAVLYLPSTFTTLFYTGPMAWNGLFAFWFPAGEFGIWFFIMFFVLRRAIRRDYHPPVEA